MHAYIMFFRSKVDKELINRVLLLEAQVQSLEIKVKQLNGTVARKLDVPRYYDEEEQIFDNEAFLGLPKKDLNRKGSV